MVLDPVPVMSLHVLGFGLTTIGAMWTRIVSMRRKHAVRATATVVSLALVLATLISVGKWRHLSSGQLSKTVPPRRLQVVISYEPADLALAEFAVKAVLGHVSVAGLTPEVVVYLKDKAANATEVGARLGAHVVRRLPDVGGDGFAYMHHILWNYDALPDHMLFMHAVPFGLVEFEQGGQPVVTETLLRRLFLFDEDTGFLPLGPFYSGNLIDEALGFPRIRDLFVYIHKKFTPAVLPAPEGHYFHDDGHIYRPPLPSTPRIPMFGHSMERGYPALFHCYDLKALDGCEPNTTGVSRVAADDQDDLPMPATREVELGSTATTPASAQASANQEAIRIKLDTEGGICTDSPTYVAGGYGQWPNFLHSKGKTFVILAFTLMVLVGVGNMAVLSAQHASRADHLYSRPLRVAWFTAGLGEKYFVLAAHQVNLTIHNFCANHSAIKVENEIFMFTDVTWVREPWLRKYMRSGLVRLVYKEPHGWPQDSQDRYEWMIEAKVADESYLNAYFHNVRYPSTVLSRAMVWPDYARKEWFDKATRLATAVDKNRFFESYSGS
ncbi:hypothetical protein HK405_010296 [Cladochytrium tenue]|nr:hypothetical protein HK405_010296 [Cladochytrium tenue]